MSDGPDPLAHDTAATIYAAFQGYHTTFQAITRRAGVRFAACDWPQVHKDAEERLDLYKTQVDTAVAGLRARLAEQAADRPFWSAVKAIFTAAIAGQPDCDIAESFYNSVTMRVLATHPMDPDIEYVGAANEPPVADDDAPVYRRYDGQSDTTALIGAILTDYPFTADSPNAARNVTCVAAAIDQYLATTGRSAAIEAIEMATPVFYRGKGAYLVGRIRIAHAAIPLLLAFVNDGGGVRVDAVLHTPDEVSMVFSFARSYFHVEVDTPHALVRFLKSIMPLKPIAELYTSIGYNKHGKTELYRDLLRHLAASDDPFVRAPGERGMVMVVFTLLSYDVVFKIIKDSFDYPKTTTRREVKSRYSLVFRHDRGGRLVDAQEFEHLRFARARFAPELLAELLDVAANTVSLDGDTVVIKHLYTERRITPLNLYFQEADPAPAAETVLDYGQCIKDLAATNIFPGDILLKNFGVTRHGRVVFYDYDELCLLTDCTFRDLPAGDDDSDDDLLAEPAFHVGEYDVFPSEMATFLGLPFALRPIFTAAHGDLFGVPFWQSLQARHHAGEVIDIFPYKESRRLE